jgi:peptidoglycan hydrolase-like protein with peptidoglycan-binding domain
MKNINTKISFLSVGVLSLALFASLAVPQKSEASITSLLSLGSRNADVTELQQFFSTNPRIYPEGIVSGYFGGLTREAVVQFQAAFDIDQVGAVGPVTRTAINNVMASGFGLDISAPIRSNLTVQTSNNSATVSWSTNELAKGQVLYSTSPIVSTEVSGHAQLPYTSGTLAVSTFPTATNSQSINLTGLQSNTQYYYVARSIDQTGNVSLSQMLTFQTN